MLIGEDDGDQRLDLVEAGSVAPLRIDEPGSVAADCMATPMAEMPQRVAEQTETWWSDQKIRRALFKDLIHWLQLNIEIDRDWRSESHRSRKSTFSQPPKAASFS